MTSSHKTREAYSAKCFPQFIIFVSVSLFHMVLKSGYFQVLKLIWCHWFPYFLMSVRISVNIFKGINFLCVHFYNTNRRLYCGIFTQNVRNSWCTPAFFLKHWNHSYTFSFLVLETLSLDLIADTHHRHDQLLKYIRNRHHNALLFEPVFFLMKWRGHANCLSWNTYIEVNS